jgi:hypothetical protein
MELVSLSNELLFKIIDFLGSINLNSLFWTQIKFQELIIIYLKKINLKINSNFYKYNYETFILSYNIYNDVKIQNHISYYYYLGYKLNTFICSDIGIKQNFITKCHSQNKKQIHNYSTNLVNNHIFYIKKYSKTNLKYYKYFKHLLLYQNRFIKFTNII